MRLPSGCEVFLKTEMKLYRACTQPASANGQTRWLADFRHPEQIAPEGLGLRLTIRGYGHLHVMNG